MNEPGGPTVTVLLATFNAEAWLQAQLDSIALQRGVRIITYASDDRSSDGTVAQLEQAAAVLHLHMLPTLPHRLGNANRNFLRLIRDCPLDQAQYFALADHDDVWLPDKLCRAIDQLAITGADAYSSNVTAFWADGRQKLLVKSGPQQRFDHLFESAGPGCTFVFPRRSFAHLQHWVRQNFAKLQAVKVHDWLIYAHARHNQWRWHIDTESQLRYRQHVRNEIGANAGLSAALERWRQIRSGDYRRDVLAIAQAVGDQSIVTRALFRLRWADRLRLAMLANQCRRKRADRLLLALFFLSMPKP
jgi:rhamnosyltransferase